VREKLADWQQEYNHERPHSSLDYRTPAEFRATLNLGMGYGDVESKLRFPHSHSPDDGCEMKNLKAKHDPENSSYEWMRFSGAGHIAVAIHVADARGITSHPACKPGGELAVR